MQTELVRVGELDGVALSNLKRAADIIRRGGLVVFPTETVYGLGADGTNPLAAKKIYAAKGRPSDNPLIIHISKPEDAEKYAFTNELYYKLAERFMPGPLTVVLPARDSVPQETRASLPTVAVRCPRNRIANKLIELSGCPIAAPSANLSGTPSPTRAAHVIADMQGRVDMIIDGDCSEIGLESTIVLIKDGELVLLRPGEITPEELLEIAPLTISAAADRALAEGEKPLSPGMKYKHYAPCADMYLLSGCLPDRIKYIFENSGSGRVAIFAYDEEYQSISAAFPDAIIYRFGKMGDAKYAASVLFDFLRDADKRGATKIYAPTPEKVGIGLALYNRMIRASAYKVIECDGK